MAVGNADYPKTAKLSTPSTNYTSNSKKFPRLLFMLQITKIILGNFHH